MKYDRLDEELLTVDIMDEFEQNLENRFSSTLKQLHDEGNPPVVQSEDFLRQYNQNYDEVFESSMLPEKLKVMIALAVASAMYSPYCIDQYYEDALGKGWNREQITEAIRVAAAIRSGFASVRAVQQMNDRDDLHRGNY